MAQDLNQKNSPMPPKSGENLISNDYTGLMGEIAELGDSPELEKVKQAKESFVVQKINQEKERTRMFLKNYKRLFPEIRQKVNDAEQEAKKMIAGHIKSEKEIDALDEGEKFILNKVRNEYKDFKEKNPGEDKFFSFDFADELDRLIYANLVYNLSFRCAGAGEAEKTAEALPQAPVFAEPKGFPEAYREMPAIDEIQEGEATAQQQEVIIPATPARVVQSNFAAKELTLDYLKAEENNLNKTKATELAKIIREWIFGQGDLYAHLTGRLSKKELVEQWLKVPENAAWISAAQRFRTEHGKKISSIKRMVKIKIGKTERNEMVYDNPYFCEGSELGYESNCFDETSGDMRQSERERIKYKAYINTDSQYVMGVFEGLIDEFSKNDDLLRYGFAAKTPAMFDPSADEIANVISQKNRIIFYFGEKTMNSALSVMQKFASKNRAILNKSGILLAQKIFDKEGRDVPAISVASETKGVSPDSSRKFPKYKTYNSMQSEIILSSIGSFMREVFTPQRLVEIGQSSPMLKQKIGNLPGNASEKDFLAVILNETIGIGLLLESLLRFYPKWSKAFGMTANNLAFKQEAGDTDEAVAFKQLASF
ncbi:MAG: hypothetical protein PHG23_02675 [Candidatus Pacebacteria bacterium]|nr:hypothetical protein [Candidatus Paceibacterota bacterium]